MVKSEAETDGLVQCTQRLNCFFMHAGEPNKNVNATEDFLDTVLSMYIYIVSTAGKIMVNDIKDPLNTEMWERPTMSREYF